MLAPRIDLYAHDDRHGKVEPASTRAVANFPDPAIEVMRNPERTRAGSPPHDRSEVCWQPTAPQSAQKLAPTRSGKTLRTSRSWAPNPAASLDATIVPELELPIDAHRPSTPRAQPDGFTTLAS
jgi:hypothetical protein